MSKKYKRVTLTLLVKASAAEQVRTELGQAADLIASDNFVYEYKIDEKRSKRPANASDYDDEDGEGSAEEQE